MTWGRIKEKLGRGGDGGLGRSHVWLTTSAFACIGEKKRQPAAWNGSFTTREMYTTFSPLSIPQFQNWEQFPSPLTLSEEGAGRESAKTRNIPTATESQTTAAATTAPRSPDQPPDRHRRTPEDPPRHWRDHTGRPNPTRQGASSGPSL